MRARQQRATRPFASVLVPLDLTPSSDRVVGRVALLPLAEGARVTLLHVVPASLSVRDQRRAARDAERALAEEARHLRQSAPVDVSLAVEVGAAAAEIATGASAAKAELIVMGRRGGRILRDAVLGSTAERVLRRGRLPVLVVRRPARAPYRRPALALDVDRAAPHVVGVALRILQPPRPRLAIIHAFEDPHPSWPYPSLANDDDRESELRVQASQALAELLAASLAEAKVAPRDVPMWKAQVRHGSPRTVIERAVRKNGNDLLLLGTRGHSGVAHTFLGTVAGDVLRAVGCDVLVVPPRA